MASGGMGDVLTGVIAGLMAQGLNGRDAARAASACMLPPAMRRHAAASAACWPATWSDSCVAW